MTYEGEAPPIITSHEPYWVRTGEQDVLIITYQTQPDGQIAEAEMTWAPYPELIGLEEAGDNA